MSLKELSSQEIESLRSRFEEEATEWFDLNAYGHRLRDTYDLPKLSSAWAWYQLGYFARRAVE